MRQLYVGSSAREPRSFHRLSIATACLVIFFATTVFRIRDYSDKALDFQVLVKMAWVAVSLIVPMVAMISGRLTLSNSVLLAWLATLVSLVISSTHAANPALSLMNSVPLLGCFLFCVWMTERLGEHAIVNLLVLVVGFVSLCSLAVYFAYPELGRMHAWLGGQFGENSRIQGIVGTPNGLGSMASMALILTVLYFGHMRGKFRVLIILSSVPSALCLLLSNSRMSMASLIVCVIVCFARKGNRVANTGMVVLGLIIIAAVFFSAPDMFLSSMARSGQASEITSGTGRSEIWVVVLERISARPLTGYGYAMSTTILPLDPRLFYAAAHCHNMFLEIMFSGGIVSFSLFIWSVMTTLYTGLRYFCFEPLVVLLLYLMRGITEPAPFYNLPSFAGYAFFLSITIIVTRARRADDREQQVRARRTALSRARCHSNLGTSNYPRKTTGELHTYLPSAATRQR